MAKAKKGKIRFFRYAFLTGAFLLITINPILNYKWNINFVQGWFQSLGIGNMWIVSPLEGLETILTGKFFYLPSIIGMLIPLTLAFLMGRVFCSWMCPITFLSMLTDKLLGLIPKFGKRLKYRNGIIVLDRRIIWFALLTELILTMIVGYPLFVWWSPPGLVGRETMFYVFYHTITIEICVVIVILLLNLITRRFFCRYLCPLGALLALVASKRQLVIEYKSDRCVSCKVCDTRCPMGIKPSIGESQSIYCWNCAECVDACPTGALKFTWRNDGIVRIENRSLLSPQAR